jgi:hypothetical protein
VTWRGAGVLAAALSVGALAGCASPGLPPGGPERHTPPVITRTQPDTNSVGVRGKEFVIHFDEVVSEHPANATSLNDLVLISPRNSAPVVDWHRSSLSIRPRKGWRPNTTYTVTLLPGISDLRGNVRTTQTVVTFSTGASIPATGIHGTLFDWTTGIPANTGMVEATVVGDTSLAYIAASDSVGHYSMIGLPPAQYRLRGYLDQNRNRALDPSEAFDTTHVYLADSLNVELLAFAHDSTGPKLGSVVVVDSVTLRAIFDTPLDPRIPLTPAGFTLTGPDSARIPVVSVAPVKQDTTRAAPPLRPVSQSVIPIPSRQPRPTRATMVLPKPTRPLLVRDVLIVIARPLHAGSTYRLDALNATGPTGKTASSDRSFQAPAPAPPAANPAPAKPANAKPPGIPVPHPAGRPVPRAR